MATTLFCKDCRHFRSNDGESLRLPTVPSCTAPQNNAQPNVVWGNIRYPSANTVRDNPELCGPGGRWFEPRPAPPPRWWGWWGWWPRLLGR